MKILLTCNKTLSNGKEEWIDGGYWNVYLPLQKLGHEVYFYDTVRGADKSYSKIVAEFQPDLIFCCMTGNKYMTPREPWKEIHSETKKGDCKTFNWFCDDTWRFENFSSKVCKLFHVCSTPEVEYVKKFKKIGYDNIIVGAWHANIDLYPKEKLDKKFNISFCGQLNRDRLFYIDLMRSSGIEIKHLHGLELEEMNRIISQTKIGINFSKNFNGKPPKTQMKGRMFEIPAAGTLLLTEYHKGLESHFEIDKEIVCFSRPPELVSKIEYLLENEKIIEKIAENGYKRFMKDHESSVRLSKVLDEIMKA